MIGESCVYYPCEKARRLGIAAACIGCQKFMKKNPEREKQVDLFDEPLNGR
jgi:hypothetical protein